MSMRPVAALTPTASNVSRVTPSTVETMLASRWCAKSLSWSTANSWSLNRAAREAVCKAQPGGDAAAEPEDINRSVGKLGDDAIVARRADIGEDRPAGKRLTDADRGRQAHRVGDQIARGQRACRIIEAEDVKLPVRQLRDDVGSGPVRSEE